MAKFEAREGKLFLDGKEVLSGWESLTGWFGFATEKVQEQMRTNLNEPGFALWATPRQPSFSI
jgi:hypothetical protein